MGGSSWGYDGGAGGAGVSIAANSVLDNAGGTIAGGRGGVSRNVVAGAGGAGVEAGAGSLIENEASSVIVGGVGAGFGPTSANGGAGIVVSLGLIENAGSIEGGSGSASTSVLAGAGGAGLSVGSGSVIENLSSGTIVGGAGGATNSGRSPNQAGTGGAGVQATGALIENSGSIAGGGGGEGLLDPFGDYSNNAAIDHGGAGGSGVAAVQSTIENFGVVTGGDGGAATDPRNAQDYLGWRVNYDGGAGGAGMAAVASTIENLGSITGGDGGEAVLVGSIVDPSGQLITYFGGAGGAGIQASNTSIDNLGSIAGGAGGAGPTVAAAGAGGAGIVGSDLAIESNGTIAGGLDPSGTRADAMTFTGGANSLALGTAAVFTGAIDVQAGTLTFDQDSDPALPADATVATAITGAGAVIKTDDGKLTLSASNSLSGGITIEEGKLELGTAGSAGSGAITFAATAGHTATLALEAGAQPAHIGVFADTLVNFGAGDALDIEGLDSTGARLVFSGRQRHAYLFAGGKVEEFTLSGTISPTYYADSDNAGGTLINDQVACYCTGTAIRTVDGDVAVESLAIGDRSSPRPASNGPSSGSVAAHMRAVLPRAIPTFCRSVSRPAHCRQRAAARPVGVAAPRHVSGRRPDRGQGSRQRRLDHAGRAGREGGVFPYRAGKP